LYLVPPKEHKATSSSAKPTSFSKHICE
jgi:hypothetical protein